MNTAAYTIYNASAGSGKTFTLVKSFLKIILENPNPDTFRSLLAITFTNKAVNEMKERIINTLQIFSNEKENANNTMFKQISAELNLSQKQLTERSEKVLQHILHNYAALSITTIDGFNHRLIRSFAFELHLNPNFEVFMDTDELLQQAVDKLLQKTGENQQITQLLTDFSKDKISENKNWDITQELLDVAKLLTIENNYEYLQTLREKSLDDFENLKKIIKNHQKNTQNSIDENVKRFFKLTQENDLSEKDFNRGSVYKFFASLKEKPSSEPSLPFTTVWATQIEDNPLYTKLLAKSSPEKAAILDQYHSAISFYFRSIEADLYQKKFYRNLLKNLIPLAVLNSIQQEIEIIKEEENILPISEFNNIINQTISGEPVPFIYERIGQRYRHYFIDEFQDTSTLQWHNMLPLIGDALHSENLSKQRGSLLLVGDAKQSIYRWRGGKAEQFMDLYLKEKNPFFTEPVVADLDKNFRSYSEIIGFNNTFFEFIAQEKNLFATELYKNLYRNASQNTHFNTEKGGYIRIEFLNTQPTDTEKIPTTELYNQAVLNAVSDALLHGFRQEDICVITRTNNQGVTVAQSLTQNGYKVISPDALLLKNIPEIQFLVHLITLSLYEDNKSVFLELLLQYAQIKQITNIHPFISKYINNPVDEFLSSEGFSFKKFHQYSFYEAVVYAIECFTLAKTSDAYLAHFLNIIFDFKNSKKGGIIDFLLFWEDKKDNLSISAPAGIDAVNVMTVHKSKGLEFPVVIYAFVNDKLTKNNDKIWLSVKDEDFGGFEYLLVDNYNGLEAVKPNEVVLQQEQQLLDQLNVMYVAMTRPEAHLYIISEEKPTKNSEEISSFSDILKRFLQHQNKWKDEQFLYEFGEKITPKHKEKKPAHYIEFVQNTQQSSYKIITRSGMLWNTQIQNAIEKGNIIHQLMASVYTFNDIQPTLNKAWQNGLITQEQLPTLQNQLSEIVNHPELRHCFTEDYIIYNEKEFINKMGEFERPDRVCLNPKNKQAIIIDYKTGNFHPKYETQLRNYSQTLNAIGWEVVQTFLVFINQVVEIKKIA